MKPLLSIIIFVSAYMLVASERIDKTIATIIGASLVLLFRLVTFEEAVVAVDFNVVFLLVGMMTCVFILSKTGFFEWVAVSVAKLAKGDPWLIMALLLSATALLSAFLDNVTIIIMFVPITILITQLLEISPVPFVIMEAIASNIGGSSTLIGDPPNIIIGSRAGLSFNSFIVNLGPVVFVTFIVFLATVYILFRKRFNVSDKIKSRVREAIPHLAIVDKKTMVRALIVLGLIFVGFFLHNLLHLEAGVIALGGSMLMLLVCKSEIEDTLVGVEWSVIFFFIGMFMMIAALEVNGVISWIGHGITNMAGKNLFFVCVVVMWGSAILSSVLDNVPFVITMVPLIKHLIDYFALNAGIADASAIHTQVAEPLWWSLVLGGCLGGNGTLVGASANIVAARLSARNHYPISFMAFFKYGFMFTLQAMILCTFYIWLRYF